MAALLQCIFGLLVNLMIATLCNSRVVSREEEVELLTKNATTILNSLLHTYDKRIRPRFGGKPVLVQSTIQIVDISEVSVSKMEYRTTLYFKQQWNDPRLQFTGLDTDYIIHSPDMLDKLWIPDTFFVNEKKSRWHEVTTKNYYLKISPNGTVMCSMRVSIRGSCPMNLRTYPLQSITCEILISSYSLPMDRLIYKWQLGRKNSIDLSEGIMLPTLDIVDFHAEEGVEYLVTGNFSTLRLSIMFKQRLSLFIMDTYLPSLLVVSLSWVSFWIDYKAAPARITLCITTVLTMITLMGSARETLPTFAYVKYSDWFLLTCLVFVFGALVEYAVVNFYDNSKLVKKRRSHPAVKHEINYTMNEDAELEMGQIKDGIPALLRINTVLQSPRDQVLSKTNEINTSNGSCSKGDGLELGVQQIKTEGSKPCDSTTHDRRAYKLDMMSRVVFPLLFVLLNAFYWTYWVMTTQLNSHDH